MNRILPQILMLSLLLVIIASGCSRHVDPEQPKSSAPEEQAHAIAEIERIGGKITVDARRADITVIGADLGNTRVTDAAMKHLEGFANLQSLVLIGSEVTDGGLMHLKGLTKLQKLVLPNHTTDAGLEHLEGLTTLQSLCLKQTKVTDEGVKKLQQVLPSCKIGW